MYKRQHLADVPRLLQEVTGALRMLDLSVPADYLVAVRGYVEHELIDQAKVPTGRQLDSLADALASIEYFLEALRDQRGNRDGILDIARQSLESLQYWPLPEHVDDEPGLRRRLQMQTTCRQRLSMPNRLPMPLQTSQATKRTRMQMSCMQRLPAAR